MLYSIVYVNFRSLSEIRSSIESLKEHHKEHLQEIEFIVVSNSPLSEEGIFKPFSDDMWHAEDPLLFQVRFIQSDQNLGFGKACNLGAANAKGEYLLFINPDTLILNPVLPILKSSWEQSKNPGLVGPALFDSSGKKALSIKNPISGWYFVWWILPFVRFLNPAAASYYPKVVSERKMVQILMGSVLFISKERFEEIGRFATQYFMYWEENDLCIRLHKAHYDVIYEPDAKVMHKGKVSTAPIVEQMEIEKHRSQKKYIETFHPDWVLLNRWCGIIAYSWRLVASMLIVNRKKMKINSLLFQWYRNEYL
jgi:GT2 family glycosyltransferase